MARDEQRSLSQMLKILIEEGLDARRSTETRKSPVSVSQDAAQVF